MFHFNPAAIGVPNYKRSSVTNDLSTPQEVEPDWEALLPSAERLLRKAKSMLSEEARYVPTVNRPWLSRYEAADYMGVSVALLDKDRVTGLHGIPFGKVGSRIVYNIEELDEFIKQNGSQR